MPSPFHLNFIQSLTSRNTCERDSTFETYRVAAQKHGQRCVMQGSYDVRQGKLEIWQRVEAFHHTCTDPAPRTPPNDAALSHLTSRDVPAPELEMWHLQILTAPDTIQPDVQNINDTDQQSK